MVVDSLSSGAISSSRAVSAAGSFAVSESPERGVEAVAVASTEESFGVGESVGSGIGGSLVSRSCSDEGNERVDEDV